MDIKITLTIHNEYELKSLLEFLKDSSITSDYVVNPLYNHNNNPEYSKYIYIPTSEFKHFCGNENLNTRGYVSIDSAMNCILKYGKRNNLLSSLYIELDSNLREALKTELYTMKINILPEHIMSLFERVDA